MVSVIYQLMFMANISFFHKFDNLVAILNIFADFMYMGLGKTSANENTTNIEHVLTLDWRWPAVHLESTFTCGETLTFF